MTKARDIASAIPAPSTVSSAELGFLDGVTSAIQTQVDAKTAKATLTTTGDIYYASAANTPARLAIGSTSNVLTVAGGIPSWAAPAGSGALTLITTSSPSASSAVSIDNCFTSTYTNYIVVANLTASSNSGLNLRLRASSTDNTSSQYVYNGAYQYIGAATAAFTTGSSGQPGTATRFDLGFVDTGGENIQNINFYSPQVAQKTTFNSVGLGAYPSTNYLLSARQAGIMTVTTAYDGFTIYPDSGTLTGKVRVYGIGQ